MKEKLLVEYIEWLSNKEDVFYAFDNPSKAAQEFLDIHFKTKEK